MISCQIIILEAPSEEQGTSKMQVYFQEMEANGPTELENIVLELLRFASGEILDTLLKFYNRDKLNFN